MSTFFIDTAGKSILGTTYKVVPPPGHFSWDPERFRSDYRYLRYLCGRCDGWWIYKAKDPEYDLARRGAFPGCRRDRLFGLMKCSVHMYTDPGYFDYVGGDLDSES